MKIPSNGVPQCVSLGITRPIGPRTQMTVGPDGTPRSNNQSEGDRFARRFVSLRERIERYVDACPKAISGRQGHNTTFKVAIALVRGFDLSPTAALPFLQRYNQRCQPKWTIKELKHKLKDADEIGLESGRLLKTRGYLL
jgi:hypothetical protein